MHTVSLRALLRTVSGNCDLSGPLWSSWTVGSLKSLLLVDLGLLDMPKGRLGLEREVREEEIPGGNVDISVNGSNFGVQNVLSIGISRQKKFQQQ